MRGATGFASCWIRCGVHFNLAPRMAFVMSTGRRILRASHRSTFFSGLSHRVVLAVERHEALVVFEARPLERAIGADALVAAGTRC